MADRRQIIFRIGEESLPAIPQSQEEYTKSPFKDALDLARDTVYDIILSAGGKTDKSPNNIVAFLGDRGSGKTSCMMTLRRGLEEPEIYGWEKPESSLCFMNIIDPSFFDRRHNILEIVIGELYRDFKEIKKGFQDFSSPERESLYELQGIFGKVKRALRFINNEADAALLEEHEELDVLSDGMNLTTLIRMLVNKYLEFKDSDALVISIDDLDVNVNEAYVMMEQIRKYLLFPGLVILMGAKLKQLNQAVRLYYHKNVLPQNDAFSNPVIPDIDIIAERFLDKLLPLSHRIFMPEVEAIAGSGISVLRNGVKEKTFDTVEFGILSLIYSKCGYLFYNYEDGPSLIIPRNLRELRQLFAMLYDMRDRGEKVNDTHEYNKEIFKQFFYDQWVATLPLDMQRIAESIHNEHNMWQLNKTVVSLLADRFRIVDDDATDEANRNRLIEICNTDTVPMNISVGDVEFLVRRIGERHLSEDVRKLMFFITTHYSILLYELYDRMTEPNNKKPDAAEGLPTLRHNIAVDIDDYFKLVGNGFFVLTGSRFIQPDLRGLSREAVMIDGSILRDKIKECIDSYGEESEGTPAVVFNLLEFFALATSRRISTKDGTFNPVNLDGWRTNNNISYIEPFNAGAKNVLFDVTAPFTNILQLKRAYDRWHPDFYKAAVECKDSLLNKLLKNRRNKELTEEHDLLSQMAIRNMEVLSDLQWWMESRRNELRPSGEGDIKVLAEFYNNFGEKKTSSYSVATYFENKSKNVNEQHRLFHLITFRPLALLGQCLDGVIDDSEASDIFWMIYRPVNKLRLGGQQYTRVEIENCFVSNGAEDIWIMFNNHPAASEVGSTTSISSLIQSLIRAGIYEASSLKNVFDDSAYVAYLHAIDTAVDTSASRAEQELKQLQDEKDYYKELVNIAVAEHEEAKSILASLKKELTALKKESKELIRELNKLNPETEYLFRKRLDDNEAQERETLGKINFLEIKIQEINEKVLSARRDVAAMTPRINEKSEYLANLKLKYRQVFVQTRRRR